jgi:hypothetical protein
MEGYYPSNRIYPQQIGEYECDGKITVDISNPEAYPLFHKGAYVLGQSVHPDMKYVVAVPDRYYFCLNRYNLYRSIHQGLPFNKKKTHYCLCRKC